MMRMKVLSIPSLVVLFLWAGASFAGDSQCGGGHDFQSTRLLARLGPVDGADAVDSAEFEGKAKFKSKENSEGQFKREFKAKVEVLDSNSLNVDENTALHLQLSRDGTPFARCTLEPETEEDGWEFKVKIKAKDGLEPKAQAGECDDLTTEAVEANFLPSVAEGDMIKVFIGNNTLPFLEGVFVTK